VLKVTDSTGKVLEELNPSAKRAQVITPELGYVMTDLLRGPVKLYLGDLGNRPVAAKSGTTEAYTGSIFIGYTPGLAVAASLMHIDAGSKCKSGFAYLATNFPPSGWQCPTSVLFGENVGISVWKPFLEEYYKSHPWPAMWVQPALDPDLGLIYVNTGNPAPRSAYYWPVSGARDPALCRDSTSVTDAGCAYDYGWHAAADALAVGARAGVPKTITWWLDVETVNSWNGDARANAADLQGMVDRLRSVSALNECR